MAVATTDHHSAGKTHASAAQTVIHANHLAHQNATAVATGIATHAATTGNGITAATTTGQDRNTSILKENLKKESLTGLTTIISLKTLASSVKTLKDLTISTDLTELKNLTEDHAKMIENAAITTTVETIVETAAFKKMHSAFLQVA